MVQQVAFWPMCGLPRGADISINSHNILPASRCENALAALKTNCTTRLDQLPSADVIAGRVVISYPLCSVINSSIACSLFLTPWKCAIVKPLHKGGDHASLINSKYCPTSLSQLLAKFLRSTFISSFNFILYIFFSYCLPQSGLWLTVPLVKCDCLT